MVFPTTLVDPAANGPSSVSRTWRYRSDPPNTGRRTSISARVSRRGSIGRFIGRFAGTARGDGSLCRLVVPGSRDRQAGGSQTR
jgi:hypothetical protein